MTDAEGLLAVYKAKNDSLGAEVERLKAELEAARATARELDSSWMIDEWEKLRPTLPKTFAPNCLAILKIKSDKHAATLAPIRREVAEHQRQWDNLMQKIAALKGKP